MPVQGAVQALHSSKRNEISQSMPKSLVDDLDVNKYSWDEVHNHRSEDDCWMVIEGKVYDLTSWVPKHPGGQLIMNGAGRDASALFVSYHPLRTQALLPKYLIGEIDDYKPYYKWQTEFYTTMKRRVEEVQKQHDLRSDSKEMYLKTFFLMLCWSLAYYLAISTGSIFAAIILGIFHGHIGIQVAHDGNHGSFSRRPWVTKIAAVSMDLMGASSVNWEIQHNVGHHPNSNRKGDYYDEDYDPDAKSGYPFVRLTPNHEWQPMHRYQHIYIWFMFSIVGLKWIYGDFRSLFLKKYQSFAYWNISIGLTLWSLFSKALFFSYTIGVFSYYYGLFTGWWMFFFFLASQSYVFILMFGVNHLTQENIFPNEESSERDWAKLQVRTASNFANNSRTWLWISGGLNFQVEHHLFPSICHIYLPYIAPVVQQTCKEFNVPYSAYDSYWDALGSYYKHIKHLGTGFPDAVKQE